MSPTWNEYNQTEKPALNLFEHLGYQVYEDQGPEREDHHHSLLLDNLRQAIKRLNPWINENNLAKAINQIRPARIRATNLMEANQIIYKRLVQYISLTQDLDQGKKSQTVKYIDFDNPSNNEYIVINQYRVIGKQIIKPDIVVFINGIPIAVIECKSDTNCDEPEKEAIKQLQRYQREAERLFYTNQILVAAWRDSASASAIGSPSREFKEWKESPEEIPLENPTLQDTLLYSMFKKERLLDLILNYTVFDQDLKKIARYQQYRSVEKALQRIQEADKLEDRNGTVWHTQGSGKSLSMLFLATKLKRWINPTMLIVTDRVDLDDQIKATFEDCGFPNPYQAENIEDLKRLIKSDANRTITTLIQKFQEPEGKYPLLTKDKDIFVLADEAHRTQYKDLATNMRTALPNACYIGFTGTPIDKESRSTIRTFGDYIDTYTIEESVEDKNTLEIKYEGRLPQLKIEGRELDDIFERTFADYSEEEKKAIKQKYAQEKDIAEATSRIETIAQDIIEHYHTKIDPLKGQIVTVSKLAAAKYAEALQKLEGPQCAVIYSEDQDNDPPLVKKYHTNSTERSQLINDFKDPNSNLTFLIVCDMLLTGFNAPVEQVMYLDKPLKEHNLLQAIARVNRLFDEKNFGLIVDYYGVFDYLKEALEIFNTKDIKNAVTPIRDEKPRLEANYRAVMQFFEGIDLQDLEACILAFEDEDKRARFKKEFKAFAKSMDIIMPDPIADPYREELKHLSKIYTAVRNHYRDDNLNITGIGEKVKRLIDEHIQASGIKRLNEPVSILDEDEFDQVLDETQSKEAKASQMEHAIKSEISVKMEENPAYYESLLERLENIIQKREQGRIGFTEEIHKLHDIIKDIRNVKSKAERVGLNEKEFALYELLLDEIEYEAAGKVNEPALTHTFTDSFQVNERIKELTQKLMGQLNEEAVIDWQRKKKITKRMRRQIKITLKDYQEFKAKLDSVTTAIMKLARKILKAG